MASLSEMTARNTAQLNTDFNKRGTAMVREFCSEHSATSKAGAAEFVFGYDTDLSLCTEWQFKIFFTGSSAINYDPIVNGNGTYKTFEEFISAYPVGSGVNTDGAWGCQCWDYGDAFWSAQVGRRLSTGGTGGAFGCWTAARAENQGSEFDLVTSWADIRKGDWIIWDRGRFAGDDWGHIAMAAENATSATATIPCYGQNQGGTPTLGGGSTINIANLGPNKFLGAFRYKGWK